MIEINRKHLAVMMEAGFIYMGMRRFKEARDLFEGITILAPESEVPHVALGNAYFCEGKIMRAIRHYEQALKLDPDSVFAKVYMGEALFFAGKTSKAIEYLDLVAKKDRGGAGEFAKALLDAINKGFKPGRG